MENISINRDFSLIKKLAQKINSASNFSNWELFKLNYTSQKNSLIFDDTSLTALKHLPHMEFLPHQLSTAHTVIQQMNGRAILADEVGLGKTIEAGLILKELLVRQLVHKVLILVPASLVSQWVQELNEKFYIQTIPYRKHFDWEQSDIVITSLDTAKRSPHREKILQQSYDLIIVDEAHKLKNEQTINYQFVRKIKKTYCLLLTATPIQNSLKEIFNLVSILRPGLLGNYESFSKSFGTNRHELMNNEYLKQLIKKVMVRNTRKKTKMNPVERQIKTINLNFTKEEEQFYKKLQGMKAVFPNLLGTTLQREICSSREACYLTLQKLHEKHRQLKQPIKSLMNQIEQLPHHKKAKKLVELIKNIGNEKIVIFTEYRATQFYLKSYLAMNNIVAVPFRGGFKRSKKDWMRQLFENQAQVMIATEAGGEGINLQFCHHLINYDLPWNPMRLEQRIGRIHRIGQTEDVQIYNFVIKGTIEEHVIKLLYEKIRLFENVVGKLDKILDTLQMNNIEQEITNIFAHSLSDDEAKVKLDHLAAIISSTNDLYSDEGRV